MLDNELNLKVEEKEKDHIKNEIVESHRNQEIAANDKPCNLVEEGKLPVVSDVPQLKDPDVTDDTEKKDDVITNHLSDNELDLKVETKEENHIKHDIVESIQNREIARGDEP